MSGKDVNIIRRLLLQWSGSRSSVQLNGEPNNK